METGLVEYAEVERTNEPHHVGQFFSLPALPSETLREIPKEWIDRLFVRLWAWYGKAIEDKWGSNTELAKSVWQEDLTGLTMQQLKNGMELCRDTCKFPPNLPEFRALCLNSGEKVDSEKHWRLCVKGRYQCLAHYWAVQRYGYHELVESTWEKARFRFPKILLETMIEERDGKLPNFPEHVEERLKQWGDYRTVAL